jgi:hypothetical protein
MGKVNLYEVDRLILEQIINLVESERSDFLSELKSITIGERNLDQIHKPCAWIWLSDYNLTSVTNFDENWDITLNIMTVYRTSDPVEGYIKASELAKKIRSVLLRSSRLGLIDVVNKIRSSRVHSTTPATVRKQDYASLVEMVISVSTRESVVK